jgi:hypothetical protein
MGRASATANLAEPAETLATAASAHCGAEDIAAFTAARADAGNELALIMMPRLRGTTREGAITVIVDRRARDTGGQPKRPPAAKGLGI